MQLEAGLLYRTRDGRKVGPMEGFGGSGCFRDTVGTGKYWGADGTGHHVPDIVAIWNDGPVRDVTRREIVAGVYGRIGVRDVGGGAVMLSLVSTTGVMSDFGAEMRKAELTAAIATLTAIRDALNEVA